ncbi:MAG: hypothetical protein Q8P57_00035 [Candidatus Pacearchaeota archaeon]|nr:hypothetical protein [Candidatus Pacearchaeota archaeon]
MKIKSILFAPLFLLIIFSISFASSYSLFSTSESWSYNEDIAGENRGFSLTFKSTEPQSTNAGCDYYDWSSDGRKCKATLALSKRNYQISQGYTESKHEFDRDKAVSQAFVTFQKDSQKQLDLEIKKEDNRNRRTYFSGWYSNYWYSWW